MGRCLKHGRATHYRERRDVMNEPMPFISVMSICSDEKIGLVAGQLRKVIGGGNYYGCPRGKSIPLQPMWVLAGPIAIPLRLVLIAN